jgi:DNA phosphorothioation-associated putative methyltransferase
MEFSTYRDLIKDIECGKALPDARYVHMDMLPYLPQSILGLLVGIQKTLLLQDFEFNVLKFYTRDFKISLLHYPTFFEESYPALSKSCTIDLVRKKYRIASYENSKNPPILHRKETFLPPDHPSIPEFEEITKEGEEIGLYENTKQIGFKQNWERLIKRKGYQLVSGRLMKVSEVGLKDKSEINVQNSDTNNIQVERHKTAIDRHKLSAPMASLARHDFLNQKHSVFDYGCGKGDDLRELQAHGISANGWDPAYFPDGEKTKQDIVNLGFVINVIEDPKERQDCIQDAYRLTKKLLVVSSMLGGPKLVEQFQPHGDGVITSRNTFQKYYTQTELKNYIEQTLKATPVAVGPGIFFVFKDSITEEEFLLNKEHRKVEWLKLSQKAKKTQKSAKKDQLTLYEKNRNIIDEFYELCLDLGRAPVSAEFDFPEQIKRIFGSIKKAYSFLIDQYGNDLFEQARQIRIEDLKVYFSLSFFSKRKPLVRMPNSLKRDIKEFFGLYTDALENSKELLFSVGKPEVILKACEYTANELNIGHLENGHNLQLHVSQLHQLPAVLRVYVGCATQLYGDIEEVDLLKIHIRSGKISLLKYDDFTNKPLPELQQRIKIKLREQQLDFFDYGEEFEPQPLYLKSRYIPPDFKYFKKQKKFDNELVLLDFVNIEGFGPKKEEFYSTLNQQGLKISKFNLKRSK